MPAPNFTRLFCVLLLATSSIAKAEVKVERDQAPVLEADHLEFDENQDSIVARGQVKLQTQARELEGDHLFWQRGKDLLQANGNVTLTGDDGTQFKASQLIFNNTLDQGNLQDADVLLTNNARLTAKTAKTSAQRMLLQSVTYTACPACEDPSDAPLWRIRTSRIDYDRVAQNIVHHHARLEVLGLPVFYTPYMAHAGPEIDRRSGFLAPRYISGDDFGAGIETPYFIDLAPNYDFTVTPRFSEVQEPFLTSTWRHLTPAGEYQLKTYLHRPTGRLVTPNPNDELRGGVHLEGRFQLTGWDTDFSLTDATDDLFFRRYEIIGDDRLESRIAANRQFENQSVQISTHHYRSTLNNETHETVKSIFPSILHQLYFESLLFGGRVTMDNQLTHSHRRRGLDITSGSSRFLWSRRLTSNAGFVWEGQNQLEVNTYHFDEAPDDPVKTDDSHDILAANSASLKLSYPLQRVTPGSQQWLDPQVQIVRATNNARYDRIPYRSGANLDLSSASLFQLNNAVNEASRVNAGLGHRLTLPNGLTTSFLVGQSYNLSDRKFAIISGYRDHASVIVSDAALSYAGFNFNQARRLDHAHQKTLRNLSEASWEYNSLRLNVSRSFYEAGEAGASRKQEQIARFAWQTHKNWHIDYAHTRDLENDRNILRQANLTYEDICTLVQLTVSRNYARYSNVVPSTSIAFTFTLKTLGAVRSR